jgi:ABC-type nitrate/sulfonate/bicarbonate transport system permease component
MHRQRWFQAGWPPLIVVILLLLIWQVAVTSAQTPGWLLPSPWQIVKEGIIQLPHILQTHLSTTIGIMLLGFVVGTTVGLIVAFLLHLLPGFKEGFYPLLILSQNIPIIASAPLLMIWFGFGLLPKVIVITMVCFFPVAVATLDGFVQTDRSMMNYLRMIGAGKRQIFFKLELPHALPFIFSGVKISATYSVMGAVIAEWLGSDKGIGVYMILSKNSFRTDRVFIAIVLIVVMSLILFGLIALLERLIIRWNTKS